MFLRKEGVLQEVVISKYEAMNGFPRHGAYLYTLS